MEFEIFISVLGHNDFVLSLIDQCIRYSAPLTHSPGSVPSALLCVQSLPFSVLGTIPSGLPYRLNLGLTDMVVRQEIRELEHEAVGVLSLDPFPD